MAESMTRVPDQSSHGTSVRARWCLAAMTGGYVALAVMAGVPNSPLATRLPVGVRPPGWATHVADALHLDGAGRPPLIVASLLVMAGVLAAFVLLLAEARANRVRLSAVLVAAGVSLAVATAAPVLLSRDVFSYAAYGRVFALHHHDPYVTVLSSFPRDPFVADTAAQWLPTHSPYGPAFTLVSAGIVRVWSSSPGAVVLAFKVLAGLGVGVATACAALAARRIRPERAALAAAIVGLNPVLVVHTVGGAHVDALIAAPLAGALALGVGARPPDGKSAPPAPLRSGAVTILLTLAVLLKSVILPALVLWLWWVVRAEPPRRRLRVAMVHLGIVVAATAASLVPFVAGGRTLTPLASLGGLESWASPAQLVARPVRAVVGWIAAPGDGVVAGRVVLGVFLLAYGVLLWRLGRRWTSPAASREETMADALGAALLLLALALPYLLPWYTAWFAPFLGLMADGVFMWTGVAAGAVLALTLIPADPFHGLSTWGVMLGVHYVAAPIMLVLLVVATRRAVTGAGRSPFAPAGRAGTRPPSPVLDRRAALERRRPRFPR